MEKFGRLIDLNKDNEVEILTEKEAAVVKGREKQKENARYSQSPFYIHYRPMLDEAKCKGTRIKSGEENSFYNPDFAEAFLRKHLAYLFLIIRLYSGHDFDETHFTRPNNGAVERYHRYVKDDIRENYQLGHVRIGNYLDRLEYRLENIDFARVRIKYSTRSYKKSGVETRARFKNAKTKTTSFFNNEVLANHIKEHAERQRQKSNQPLSQPVVQAPRQAVRQTVSQPISHENTYQENVVQNKSVILTRETYNLRTAVRQNNKRPRYLMSDDDEEDN